MHKVTTMLKPRKIAKELAKTIQSYQCNSTTQKSKGGVKRSKRVK